MLGIKWAQPFEVTEHGNRFVEIAPHLKRMRQRVGRLGPDRSRGSVKTDGLVGARQPLKHLPQLIVDPDITRMALLGSPQHRLGLLFVAGSAQIGPEQLQADRPQLVELRRLRQCVQRGLPHRLVRLVECGPQLVSPRVGVGDACGRAQSRRSGPILQRHTADARPIVKCGGQSQRNRRRAGLDLRPLLLGRQAREIDLGLAEGFGIGGIGVRAIVVVGFGRTNFDQAIE